MFYIANVDSLKDQINLIDNNVKFTITMFGTAITIAIAIAGAALYFLSKYLCKKGADKAVEDLKKEYNKKLSQLDSIQTTFQKQISSKLDKFDIGLWTPKFADHNSSKQGSYVMIEKTVVVSFNSPIPDNIKIDPNKYLCLEGLPFACRALLSSDITILDSNNKLNLKNVKALPIDTISTGFQLIEQSTNRNIPLTCQILQESTSIFGTLVYEMS